MNDRYTRRGSRCPTRLWDIRKHDLSLDDLKKLAETIEDHIELLRDYVGERPKKDRNGNVLIIEGIDARGCVVVTRDELMRGDGSLRVELSEKARCQISRFLK